MLELFTGKVHLKVTGGTPFDEIYLIDGGYQLVAKDVGQLDVPSLDPGLYKLKFKNGDTVSEKSVILNQAEVSETVPQAQLVSPVPIGDPGIVVQPEALTRGDVHSLAPAHANRFGKPRPVKSIYNPVAQGFVGQGCELFFFIQANGLLPPDLIDAITLFNAEGRDLKRIIKVDHQALTALVSCEPGFYRLRVDMGDLGSIEMGLWTLEGYRTCVFLPLRGVGVSTVVTRPDLANAAVTMWRLPSPGLPDWNEVKRTEQLRSSLQAGRTSVANRGLEQILLDKWSDPIGGMLGAHLLLLESPVNAGLFSEVTGKLRSIAGAHPDVQLLCLYALKLVKKAATPITLTKPPMLSASWRLLGDPWMKEMVEIPPASTAATVTGQLWGQSIWLLWRAF